MVVGEVDYFGKQHAEESRHGGGAVKKQRVDTELRDRADSEELLAWELEQEKWTNKSDEAILEDPQWQRVGINQRRETSESSSDDDGSQSPMMMPHESQISQALPHAMSPAPQASSNSFLFEDQRKVNTQHRLSSPATLRHISSMKSSASETVYSAPEMSMRRNYPNSQSYASPNMRSPSPPPPSAQHNSSMTGVSMYSGVTPTNSFGYPSSAAKLGYQNQNQNQNLLTAASWNSHGGMSRKDEADDLEAEFQRLENRGGNSGFQGAEGRDDAVVLLEQEFQRLETRNKDVTFVDESPSDEVIHLEDQGSMPDEDELTEIMGCGALDLEVEFDNAVRRKEALLRQCSMDSDEADDILGDTSPERVEKKGLSEKVDQGPIPKRNTRLQERLDRLELASIDAEPTTDVSKYPRLLQIRQKRRERLKALKAIRQERAEIWDTLEANWEHVENSMTTARAVANVHVTKNDPDPVTTDGKGGIKESPPDMALMADDDSLRLSASDPSATEAGEALIELDLAAGGSFLEQAQDQAEPTSDLVELLASVNEKNRCAASVASMNLAVDSIPASTVSLLESMTADPHEMEEIDADGNITRKEDPPSFGAFLTQSMSDVGSNFVNMLKAVGSVEEQQQEEQQEQQQQEQYQEQEQVVTFQGTDTYEEDTGFATAPTEDSGLAAPTEEVLEEEAQEDDESAALDMELTGFAEAEPVFVQEAEPEAQGQGQMCAASPVLLESLLLCKQRRVIVDGDGEGGCINPFAQFGFKHAQQMCFPRNRSPTIQETTTETQGSFDPMTGDTSFEPMTGDRGSFDPTEGSIDLMPSNYSDSNYYVENNWTEEEDNKFMTSPPPDDSDSQGDDEREPTTAEKQSKRSKKSKKTKKDAINYAAAGGGAGETFFTLVDSLLVNSILNSVDEKVVNDMAHKFGFD